MAGFGTGIVAANEAGDNSTIIDVTEIEETNVDYAETDNSVEITDIDTTEITDIDNTDTTIVGDGNDANTFRSDVVVYNEENTNVNNTYTSDYDYNSTYSDNDNTILENSTQVIDNSYKSSYNSEIIIQTTEINQVNIDNSKTVSIDVKNNNSVVNNIYFVPTKDAGKAKVVVEDLKPESIEKPPAGVVYKSFNIFIDNGNKQVIDIDNAAVDFKVEKSWLIANEIDSSTIVLNMYESGKWMEVPITITGEDSQYIYFKAAVSQYSTFAITSKAITVDAVLKQTGSQNTSISEEEIDGPTKNVIIKLLEFAIELLKGN